MVVEWDLLAVNSKTVLMRNPDLLARTFPKGQSFRGRLLCFLPRVSLLLGTGNREIEQFDRRQRLG